ncbi:hypothetical protein [Isoptericola cucumis]|uniref:Phage Mu protein F like protein n=1 Tax=Isoptericola cucumis TaxID=1776856 RepID=A0ABQ2B3D6_9MICO|nr:hypothetical protein [Isoptericola cucumis]GGI07002.1 hypothetical protein GCM10007368_13980 [Isoptericola cucumis]
MTYRDALQALSSETEAKVLAIYAAFSEGSITYDEAAAAIAAVVVKGNARAVALADLALAANLMTALRKPVATLGLALPDGEPARLHKAATTLLAIREVTPERVARLGRVEPLEAGQRAFSEGIARSGSVEGWVRNKSASACQLCTWWSRDGRVWPAGHPMPRHKGCSCTQTIVHVDRVQETAAGRKERIAREAATNTRRYNP